MGVGLRTCSRSRQAVNEFTFIRDLLAPLARSFPGALGLADDAAAFSIPEGRELIVTKDALAEGVHFTGREPARLIAQKLLRVNLSDLAAMGADPLCYFLALLLPASVGDNWLADFASGLAEDQKLFNIALAGGDTARTPGPLCLSLTALGTVPAGRALRRSGARAGDAVYVSGTIGDAALGLKIERGEIACGIAEDAEYLHARYLLPQPRLALGAALRGIAAAAVDISDGLAADLAHICESSGTGALIRADAVPLSPPARALLERDGSLLASILSGGDDYELCFAVAAEKCARAEEISRALGIPIAPIGEITAGGGVRITDARGRDIVLPAPGYTHF